MSAPTYPRVRSTRWLLLAAFAVPLYFAFCTNHLWEDFFITYRVSQNLVHGHGLVFQPGEHVHTFTSPLGVLLPALCSWVVGGHNDPAAIWLFRVLCSGFLAASMALVLRLTRHLQLGTAGMVATVGLFLLDAKISDFTSDGMETAIVLFFFLWTMLALIEERGRMLRLGIGVAGLLWSRPDGFVFAGAMIVGFGVFDWFAVKETTGRRNYLRSLIAALVLGGVIYLPWFVWAWHYYGSPIPNTILAKSAGVGGEGVAGILQYVPRLLGGNAWITRIFMPSNYMLGGWGEMLFGFSCVLTIPATLYFLLPRANRVGRAMSLSLFLGGIYLESIPQFPWYYPWWQVLALLVDGAIVSDLFAACARLAAHSPGLAVRYRRGLGAFVGALLAVQLGVWCCSAVQMQLNQRIIEDGVRRPIGEWLHAHARPGDTVMTEPLGYFGYYSQLKMLDWPGLSAPEMTRAIKEGINSWPALIEHFQPDWVVFRPREVKAVLAKDEKAFRAEYQFQFAMDARSRIAAHRFYPGRDFAMYDSVFMVYRRVTPRRTEVGAVAGTR
ncbi:MAG TPA: hypothetical protein VHE61_08635 [Opitutaceae bacterium]|nr:hypothetical protein [Opitutaceae bacterium]